VINEEGMAKVIQWVGSTKETRGGTAMRCKLVAAQEGNPACTKLMRPRATHTCKQCRNSVCDGHLADA
jgi:hypothetical protein